MFKQRAQALRLRNINGRIDGTTSGGNINLKAFESDAALQTSGGGITLEGRHR